MKKLEIRLKELQKKGYETIDIDMVLRWINEFRREKQAEYLEKRELKEFFKEK